MTRLHLNPERHLVSRIGWLRAAVLGANDGIVSTASLIIGVAAAAAKPADILVAGVAGLVAGAMSMAAGEYVSVSSQSDTERADLARERGELAGNVEAEVHELAGIYVKRGVDAATADTVARQLMAKDALAAHAHDELGISEMTTARPIQAALTSAATFYRRRRSAAGDRDHRARRLAGRDRSDCLAPVPCSARRGWRAGGRSAGVDRNAARDILGRAGDGGDCGDRIDGRNGSMMPSRHPRGLATPPPTRLRE